MKRSQELMGLTVIGIEDGKDVGRVIDFVICPSKGSVEYLVLDDGIKYLGIKFLPFNQVEGVGEHAVTVLNTSSVVSLAEQTDVKVLLEKDIQLKGSRVVTRKGMLIGVVTEFFIDCESGGRINGCEITPAAVTAKPQMILSEQVITYGKDILVVSDEVQAGAVEFFADGGTGGSKKALKPVQVLGTATKEEPSDAARMFEERQRQYLIGRKLSKRIETDNGELIGDEGQTITEELLDLAKQMGKFAELSMNTKS